MRRKSLGFSLSLFLVALFVSPLIFFTDRTRNPYLIQERILQTLLVFVLILCALKAFKNRRLLLSETFIDRPLFIYLVFIIISSVVAFVKYPDYALAFKDYSFRAILTFFFSGIIPFYFASSKTEETGARSIRRVIIVVGSIAALYSIVQFARLDFIWPSNINPYGQRSISTFGNPNFLAPFLVIVIFWLIYESVLNRMSSFLILLLFINLVGLAITMTRSAFVGLFAGCILLGFLFLKDKELSKSSLKSIAKYLIAGIVFFGLLFSFISPQFRERAVSVFSPSRMGSALTQRLLIWEASIAMFQKSPYIGIGWGNFEVFYPSYQGQLLLKDLYAPLRTHANNAHNILLEHLTEIGLIGTLVFLFLIVCYFRRSIRLSLKADPKSRLLMLILISASAAFLVDNLFNVSYFFPIPSLIFWLNSGLIAGHIRGLSDSPNRELKFGKFAYPLLILAIGLLSKVLIHNYRYFKGAEHFYTGFKASRSGELATAEKELQKSYSYYPRLVDANYEMGNVYARFAVADSGYLDDAIWAYEEAIKSNPGYDEIYYNLAIMLIRKEEYASALENLKFALKLNPVSHEIARVKAGLYSQLGNYSDAEKFYLRSLEIEPSNPLASNSLGGLLERREEYRAAASRYIEALFASPDFTAAASNAKRVSSILTNTNEDVLLVLHKETVNHLLENDFSAAEATANGALDINPAYEPILLLLAELYFMSGEYKLAEPLYQALKALLPGEKHIVLRLEEILQK